MEILAMLIGSGNLFGLYRGFPASRRTQPAPKNTLPHQQDPSSARPRKSSGLIDLKIQLVVILSLISTNTIPLSALLNHQLYCKNPNELPESTTYNMKTETHPCQYKFGFYFIVFARYAVLASTAITTYCLCYLVDQHRRHYCTWGYGTRCTAEQQKNIEVPWAEVVFITAVCITLSLHPSTLSPTRLI